MPEISIIIVTFNSARFIHACLDSVFKQDYEDYEVLVIDNGSKDNTIAVISSYPEIKLIKNKDNLGACLARNQGIRASQGQWVLALDCDVVLERGFLGAIIKAAKNSGDDIGMIQPKVLSEDRSTIFSCGIYLSRILRRFFDIGKGKKDKGQFDAQRQIFGASSAAALYRRKMLEEIEEKTGYFDESFFFLVEDVDLSWRAQRAGYKALYVPAAVCFHQGNSSGTDFRLRQYLCFRNRNLSIKKNENFAYLPRRFVSFIFYDFPRHVYLMLVNPNTINGNRSKAIL